MLRLLMLSSILIVVVGCGSIMEREPDSAIGVVEYEGQVESGILAIPYGNLNGNAQGCRMHQWGQPKGTFLYNGQRCIIEVYEDDGQNNADVEEP